MNIGKSLARFGAVASLLFTLSACAGGTGAGTEINDPFEVLNRQMHNFNKAVDTVALRPASEIYGAVIPSPVQDMVSNSASNLSLPRQAVNHLLQGDIPATFETTLRFTVNSTLGIGGLFDPASEMGLFEQNTNFGETLAIWGIAEGPYLELPLLGPSTVRGTVGQVVDGYLDPLQYFISPQDARYISMLKSANMLGKRYAYSDIVNVLLYESSDSYAAQRISYLQNLRRNTQGETVLEDLEDPYAF